MTRIDGLDGTRALAIGMVIVAHLGFFSGLPGEVRYLASGRTGVEIFFVLSGFLITHLLVLERRQFGGISIKKFYGRRVLRILPAYWSFLIVVTAVSLAGFLSIHPVSAWMAWLHCYNFIPQDRLTGVLTHTWSLAVEEHFYLIWPAVFALTFRKAGRASVTAVVIWLVLCVVSSFLLPSISSIEEGFFPSWWTIPASGSIATGALLALIFGGRDRLRRPGRSLSAFVVAAMFFGAGVFVGRLGGNDVLLHWLRTAGIAAAFYGTLTLPTSSIAIRSLEFPLFVWVGKVSYGLYLWQGFFLTTKPRTSPEDSWPLAPWTGIFLTFVFAALSHYTVEKYFLSKKGRFIRAK